MNPSPWADVLAFMTAPGWVTPAFWALLLTSAAVAVFAWTGDIGQRTARGVGVWLVRVVLGACWWQQSLWKIPPDYDGLIHWMQEMVDHASLPLQSAFVRDTVIPNIHVVGPLVYAVEVGIGVSLILGLFSRIGALAGLAMALNLWLGLYSAPGEWPWTYAYLILLQILFVLHPPGRCLGLDALLGRVRPLPSLLA